MATEASYALKVTVHDRYVRIAASGNVQGLAAWTDVFADVAHAANAHRRGPILLDLCHLEGGQSIAEDFMLATALPDLGLLGTRVAMVESAHNVGASRFFETTARNRGAQLRVFTDQQAALGWLLATDEN